MANYIQWTPVSLNETLTYFNNLHKRAKSPKELYDYNIKISNFISPTFNAKKIEDLHNGNYKVIAKKSGNRYRLDISKGTKITYDVLPVRQIKELQDFKNYLLSNEVKKDLKKRNNMFYVGMGILAIFVIAIIILFIKFNLF